jgi:flagellar hook-length control protein FliK
MTPTNLPVQPATPATPAQGSTATAATEPTTATDFLLMLGQLVAASVQRSGTSVAPTTKAPTMALDDAKKDEIDPEQLLAMFAMAVPAQMHPINIEVPVGQALQALSGVSGQAGGTDGPMQNLLQEVAKQITDSKLFAGINADGAAQSTEAPKAADGSQVPTLPLQLQQPQVQSNPHAHDAISRPVHAPVGTAAWADEIGARVVMMSESGNHSASLKLSPEHLGPLEINITVRDDKASVWFGAAHADTRAAIETALPRLREMFASQGLSLADAGVFREPPREQQPVVKNATGSTGQGDATEEVAAVSARARLGLVDAYA